MTAPVALTEEEASMVLSNCAAEVGWLPPAGPIEVLGGHLGNALGQAWFFEFDHTEDADSWAACIRVVPRRQR